MAIVLSGSTGIDAGSLPVANTGKISAGAGLSAILNTAGVDRVIVDTTGNVGIGVVPSAWRSTQKVVELPGGGAISNFNGLTNLSMSSNMYINSSAQSIYKNNGYASYYSQSDSIHQWYTAPSGIAENPITWTNAMSLDQSGNLLLKSGTGGLGYGTGAGGTVTQLTSKSTAVTLNKPSGTITMNNAALAAGAVAEFALNNTLISINDIVLVQIVSASQTLNYSVQAVTPGTNGVAYIQVKNIYSGSLSDAVKVQFSIIKGAIS